MRFWLTLVLSLLAIFVLLDRSADALGSVRGEAGIPLAVLTLPGGNGVVPGGVVSARPSVRAWGPDNVGAGVVALLHPEPD